MKNAWREESGRQDDVEADGTTVSFDCSSSCRNFELARCTSEGFLIRKVDLDRTLESDSRKLRVVAKFACRISFGGGRFRGFDSRIPRNVLSLDEQYLRQCLEWVCGKASKVMPSDAPLALAASVIDSNSKLWRRFAVKRASRPESMNLNVDSARSLNSNVDSARSLYCHGIAATDMKPIGWIDHHHLQSPALYSTDMRSVNSVLWAGVSSSFSSGRSSNSAAARSVSQGMLAFGWMNGMPCFVFSPDETRKVYVADLTSVISSNRIDPNYKYLIRINEHGMKERAMDNGCNYLVGEINVVESISICSDVSETRTTEFVLFGGYKIPVEEERGDPTRKNKGLPSKAVKAFSFKSRRSSKRRNTPCRSGISEDFSTESSQDKVTVLHSYRHHSNELAAIVVKDRVKRTAAEQKPEAGGWGLKFLRKIEAANINRHSNECSESMDVIIPAGLHGGPRSESGGTSSLIERWKSGGKCDCGGWDLGCPLTLLEARSNKPAGNLWMVDLFVGGSNTTLRMTNVRDGLFLIRFDPSLSALQTLSVAVAYIHTHSPLLQQRLRPS